MAVKKKSPVAIALVVLVALAIAVVWLSGVYTDYLWFDQLGFSTVFTTGIWASITAFMGGFLISALTVFLAGWLAAKTRPVYATSVSSSLDAYRQLLERSRVVWLAVIPALAGLIGGSYAAGKWQTIAMFANHTYTGVRDAQFGLDTGFYLFDLPFYDVVAGFVTVLALVALLMSTGMHLLFGALSINGRKFSFTRPARIQIASIAAIFIALQGAALWLDQYATMTSNSGLFTGATYSDVHAAIPAFEILAAIAIFVALLFLVAAITARWKLALTSTGLLLVSSLLLAGVFPWGMQTFVVVPNERNFEAQFIKRNIDATLQAYGLSSIKTVDYQAKTTADAATLRGDATTAANIRIIDPTLVSSAFKQLQQVQQYYSFGTQLDVDRYNIGGKTQDTVLAVRELNQSGLGSSQSWYNNVIVYTHGYGVVAAYGNQASTDGQPVFLQSGIPNVGELGSFEPRVYFGEQSPTYSIVGATGSKRELDYPSAGSGSAASYTFDGNGGPSLRGIINRLAYAIKFQSEQILLSDAIGDKSQILYNRNPIERVSAVAPYLTLDSDAYPAVVDGRLKWIVDGYTTSANYPYASAENYANAISDSKTNPTYSRGNINYIRNSVKATVDAYDGSVTLYAWDTQDPILKTWQKIYPNTTKPISAMSAQLLSHVRYPSDLFKIQRAILGKYHVTDAGVFYSQSDGWMTPNDPTSDATGAGSNTNQPPYYLSMQLPGATSTDFSLYTTFIPQSTADQSRNVLRGYLVANSDAGTNAGQKASSYGQLTLLTIPKALNIAGPGMVQNNFNADSDVSKLLNILRQGSTSVLDGNLLTIPVGGGLLYVQPVYVKSTGETSYPLLKKVLVAFGDRIAFEDTLNGALDSLFGSSVITDGSNSGGSSGTGTSTGSTGSSVNAKLKAQLAIANQAMQDKAAALASGDWAAYGKADAKLKAAIDAMIKLTH
ncbi:MAG: UPF0182 family protein [Rhodoluna sp.]